MEKFRLVAGLICIVSATTICVTFIGFFHFASKIERVENDIFAKQSAFKAKSQVIWAELVETGRNLRIPRSAYGSEEKKGVLHQCSRE